jgi:sugar phosphate isomerase/epimerase
MKPGNRLSLIRPFALLLLGSALMLQSASAEEARAERGRGNLWSRDNLLAWCVVPFDAKKRSPEERAQMLERLGFNHFAYDWRDSDIPTFDAEIEALQRHGIEITAWWFPLTADDPLAKSTLETFRRHGVQPQLWVISTRKAPEVAGMPQTEEEYNELTPEQLKALALKEWQADNPKSREEQQARVNEEADRIAALDRLASPYGVKVELYNHNGWFGMEENQLAIIGRLKQLGVSDVGMVYNFSHARDEVHDDTKHFRSLWERMKSHVVVVNVTGTNMDGHLIYPSQGDRELEMMRTIQQSGWSGRVGVIAEKGGDAEVTLKSYLIGLDWLAAELREPGSGGAKPSFPPSE